MASFLAGDNYRKACKLFREHFSVDAGDRGEEHARKLVRCFSRIPYENISKIIKSSKPASLESRVRLPLEVMEDHVTRNLGGTCFSLTFFLENLFRDAGLDCYKVMADMKSGENVHTAVVVKIGPRKFLADPGYCMNVLVPMDGPMVHAVATSFGGVELQYRPDENRYHLFTSRADEKKWRYVFRDIPVSDGDFERYWEESFRKPTLGQICLYKATEEGLLYVHNTHLRLTSYSKLHREDISENMYSRLETLFGIDPALIEEAQSILVSSGGGSSNDYPSED